MYWVGEVVVLADPEDLQAAKTERIQSYMKCWQRKHQRKHQVHE